MITATIITVLMALTVSPTVPDVFIEVNDLPAPVEIAVEEPETVSEVEYEPECDWEPQSQDYGVTGDYSASYDGYWTESAVSYDAGDGISATEFQWLGVVEDGEHFYTWYSERTLPGYGLTELNENGRWSDGEFVRDGDGFIAVASCDHEKGEVIETPWGAAKVYDTGYLQPGQIDVYTSF